MRFVFVRKTPVWGDRILKLLPLLFIFIACSATAQDNLSSEQDSNLLPPIELDESEDSETEESGEQSSSSRRVRRLGDVQTEEWQPLFDAAPGSRRTTGPALPNPEQSRRLYELLDDLAATPGNAAVRRELEALLDDVIDQADEKIIRNQLDEAKSLLDVVKTVSPNKSGLDDAYTRLEDRGDIGGQLTLAREAMDDGRIVEPQGNNAWFYYRNVADRDPNNIAAQLGLEQVQKYLIGEALQYARDLDFESTHRILEEARLVREDHTLIEEAELEVQAIRHAHAQNLEAQAVSAMDSGDFRRAERFLVDLVALGGEEVLLGQLRRRLEEARVYGGFKPGQVIRDHFLRGASWAPDTVVINAGSFLMGSDTFDEGHVENESPEHRVNIRRGFALGRQEVSVAEFRRFAESAGYASDAERKGFSVIYNHSSGRLTQRKGITWENSYDGRIARDNDPVVHVSWNDATAYVRWLARNTGKPYRLPSEAEFEYALRGGTSSGYWWGDGSPARVVENLTGDGDESRSRRSWTVAFDNYDDGFWGPAPVGSFAANPYNLMDISGNVAEWVTDCWHDTYLRAPDDGSAWVNPGCELRVIRGGYWASSPTQTRSAFRLFSQPDTSGARVGFRVARDL